MQIFHDTFSDYDKNLLKPLAQQSLMKILDKLGFINFFDNNFYYYHNSSSGSKTKTKNNNIKLNDNRINCRVTEIFNPSNVENIKPKSLGYQGFTSNKINRTTPIFNDEEHNISLHSIRAPMKMTLDIRALFLDITHARNFMIRMFNVYGSKFASIPLNFAYDMSVPNNIILIQFILYKLLDLDINNFYNYLKDNSGNSITFNSNSFGTRKELVIRHANIDVPVDILMEQDNIETIQVEQVANHFAIEFQVNFLIDVPTILFLQYPESINNKLIPEDIWPNADFESKLHIDGHYDAKALDNYFQTYCNLRDKYYNIPIKKYDKYVNESTDNKPYFESVFVYIPWFDTWQIPVGSYLNNTKDYSPFMSILFTLDEGEYTTLDLSGPLDHLALTEYTLECLNEDNNNCLYYYQNPKILLQVFNNDEQVEPVLLNFNNNILTIPNVDFKSSYRVVLSKGECYGYNKYIKRWNVDINVSRRNT